METDRDFMQQAAGAVAYAMVDNSMDIADRGGIPGDVWDSACDDAEVALAFIRDALHQDDEAAAVVRKALGLTIERNGPGYYGNARVVGEWQVM